MSKRLRKFEHFAVAGSIMAILALAAASSASAESFGYHNIGYFGETGAGEGMFAASPIPQRMAVDPYGNVYVADRGNNRVEIFEGSEEGGTFMTKFAVTAPIGVAVDPSSGAVYVTRAGTNEKQTITPPGSGTYTLTFEGQTTASLSSGATNTQIQEALWNLSKIGPANVYVTSGKEVIFQGGLGGQDVPQLVPSAGSVATNTAGASGTVSKFIPFEFEFPPSYGTTYAADPEFVAPTGVAIAGAHTSNSGAVGGIAVDPKTGNFLVISGKTVKRFGENGGAALSSFDGSGSGTAFNDPADIAVDPTGKVLVADITSASAARVVRFSGDGTTASTLSPAVPNPVVAPAGATANMAGISVGVDPVSGEAFVSSKSPEAKSPGRIYRFSAANAFIESFGVPAEMGTGLNGPITGIGTKGASEGGSLFVMSTSETGEPAVQVFKPLENFPLTLNVVKEKTGNGTVKCSANGQPAETCAAEYPLGTELAVLATPGEGSIFEFSGDCEGETCELLIEEPHTVTVTFKPEPLPDQALNLTIAGSGAGTVECKVDGGPAEECASAYPAESKVALLAKASVGSDFIEWREDCTGSGSCEVTMDKEHSVTAIFNLTGTTPTVTGVSPSKGSAEGGTEVTITGSKFTGTPEVKFGETKAASVTVESATQIKATTPGHAPGAVHVTVTVAGSTSASTAADQYTFIAAPTVTGINPKEGTAGGGTSVTITGTNLNGATAVKFGATSATVTEDTATQIKATSPEHVASTVHVTVTTAGGTSVSGPADEFKYIARTYTLTIGKAGTGTGSVSCNGGACAASYSEGTVVTLAATPASGSTFAGWSGGGCSGTGSCQVTMSAATAVTATFNANPIEEPPTCATNPALCPPPPPPPPPPTAGTATVGATAKVKAGKAQLKLTCSGGACSGSLKLTAKLKVGGKTKSMVIGKGSFSLASGAATTLKVKLSAAALKVLKGGKALKASVTGTGITPRTVKLK